MPFVKGYEMSEEHKRKISLSHKKSGHRPNEKAMEKVRIVNSRKHSEEERKKQSEIYKILGICPPHPKGENHYAWKGGVTPLYHRIRTSFKYRQWRSDVFTRDNFSCQDCGDNRGGNLNAHHIISFNSIIQKYEIFDYETALKCEVLWDINNGVTLCECCHIKKHGRMD